MPAHPCMEQHCARMHAAVSCARQCSRREDAECGMAHEAGTQRRAVCDTTIQRGRTLSKMQDWIRGDSGGGFWSTKPRLAVSLQSCAEPSRPLDLQQRALATNSLVSGLLYGVMHCLIKPD